MKSMTVPKQLQEQADINYCPSFRNKSDILDSLDFMIVYYGESKPQNSHESLKYWHKGQGQRPIIPAFLGSFFLMWLFFPK